MASGRAPKQWSLTKEETITSFEAWRQNLQYILSLDSNFANFLLDETTWRRKSSTHPTRGFTDDGEDVPQASRRTAAQKVTQLELMLGQIANFCPVVSRNTIVKNSTSMQSIWQSIRAHFGFQSTGARFLDFSNIHLESGERPEDLYQRLVSFIDDNLLKANDPIRHHGENTTTDEEITPTLENLIVITWLRLVHPELPALVKQRYGTELRSQTLASLKPEISQALDSLLDEIHVNNETKVLRTAFRQPLTPHAVNAQSQKTIKPKSTTSKTKSCPLCKQANRLQFHHYLSRCPFLPAEDRHYLTRARQIMTDSPDIPFSDSDPDDTSTAHPASHSNRVKSTSRRVSTKQSPHLKVFYQHHALQITLDTGAETSMIKASVALQIGATVLKTKQTALQADGITPLTVIGEVHLTLHRNHIDLHLDALVVEELDVDILAGTPFMSANDISVRPARQQISIHGSHACYYGADALEASQNRIRRTQAQVLRAPPKSTVVWPGDYVELDLPPDIQPDATLAIEPRPDYAKTVCDWPTPNIVQAVAGQVRILNTTNKPQQLSRHEHFCQVFHTRQPETATTPTAPPKHVELPSAPTVAAHSSTVQLDPDHILPANIRTEFQQILQKYDTVFDPSFTGYNGAVGPFEATVNMGPVQPPQRKGRLPQYSRNKLVELQDKFDQLEQQGVFQRPEDIGITIEYLNPSFLVSKPSGGHRLVTAFADVARYSKPQPSLMPDVDSTLRTIAQWKYLIVTDLTSAFYQIPLAKESIKYCGVATPFRGIRAYTRCAMGMPGSETALEELMCRVLGDCLQDGIATKLADDLYCGADTLEGLLQNWQRILDALAKCNLRLSPSKTVICPRSTTVLGWIWTQGSLTASPHRVATLSSCPPPDTIRGLRSFLGAYKALSRVLPKCSQLLAPLEQVCAGQESRMKMKWTDTLLEHFRFAQKSLAEHKSITLPRPSDQLWIVTDGSVTKYGIGATLYINRENKIHLAGFFSAKLRKHQVTWLPCEVEALSIATSIKHFSPYIIQSTQQVCLLTDSKPCVQAVEKLCRGEFSASPRVTSFLSIVSRYAVHVQHLAGSANIPSDFSSRNAAECTEPRCQVCTFIAVTEASVVRATSVQDIRNMSRLPFTTRSAWSAIQAECPDLRRTHAHLKQGTRPSKKATNIKDVKKYLNVASIAKDGVLVVPRTDPLSLSTEAIIVPRSALDGLVTALHLRLDHPTPHQLHLAMKRHFYALDMTKSIERVYDTCHTCASLRHLPPPLLQHTTCDPPSVVGISFAADVLRRSKQNILILRETTTSFTSATIIPDEKSTTLRDSLSTLIVALRSPDGPPATVRVDPAPGFTALQHDPTLQQTSITLEIGRSKNVNKNPVAEKAVAELEEELRRQKPDGSSVTQLELSLAVSRLNSRFRRHGVSAHELWTHRDQFSNVQIPIKDTDIITKQHNERIKNHPYSERSKNSRNTTAGQPSRKIKVGDLVYLSTDRDKTKCRNRYLVLSIKHPFCFVQKFTDTQLRAASYKVRIDECFRVSDNVKQPFYSRFVESDDSEEEQPIPAETVLPNPPEIPDVLQVSPPSLLTRPSRTRHPPTYFEYEQW